MDGNQTKTNGSSCLYHPSDLLYTVTYGYILTICVLGIILNAFVLLVLFLHKKACTVAEIYLSNLAAADLPLLSALPFWAEYVINEYDWSFGRGLCKMVNVFVNMSAYCSIYSLVLVSIDRYLALVFPLSHQRLRRPVFAKVGCLLVWVFSFLLNVPTLIYRDVKKRGNNSSVCGTYYPNDSINLGLDIMQIMLIFFIPLFIISFYTLKTFQVLRNRSMEGVNVQKREKKATFLIIAALLVLLVCWIPFHMIKIIDLLNMFNVLKFTCNTRIFMYVWAPIFMYLKLPISVLNPILYFFVGKNFRKKVKEISECKCQK